MGKEPCSYGKQKRLRDMRGVEVKVKLDGE
ncbi:hypothetical protein AVEN_201897-1, partial [Araneus ventricosus]